MTWTPPDWLLNSAVVVAVLSLVGIVIRMIGPWRKIVIEEEAQFRANLIATNEALVARIDRVERILRRERAIRGAERMLAGHKHNNLAACLDAAMMMLEMTPDRALEIVVKIRAMREKQMVAEASEAAIIHAAEIRANEAEDGEPEHEQEGER